MKIYQLFDCFLHDFQANAPWFELLKKFSSNLLPHGFLKNSSVWLLTAVTRATWKTLTLIYKNKVYLNHIYGVTRSAWWSHCFNGSWAPFTTRHGLVTVTIVIRNHWSQRKEKNVCLLISHTVWTKFMTCGSLWSASQLQGGWRRWCLEKIWSLSDQFQPAKEYGKQGKKTLWNWHDKMGPTQGSSGQIYKSTFEPSSLDKYESMVIFTMYIPVFAFSSVCIFDVLRLEFFDGRVFAKKICWLSRFPSYRILVLFSKFIWNAYFHRDTTQGTGTSQDVFQRNGQELEHASTHSIHNLHPVVTLDSWLWKLCYKFPLFPKHLI